MTSNNFLWPQNCFLWFFNNPYLILKFLFLRLNFGFSNLSLLSIGLFKKLWFLSSLVLHIDTFFSIILGLT
ncbi:hypothetical protein TRFO_14905 [Tritrichomonas foetus]|uniref:Uncharacterized protein n=1 Tax=Tritrichomonas foetus TaxID=1144522 RepID=A0A1J4KY42_9EUKA|nr:hypothetical protein TRFO_14905 [Tritrichomonas foetus]|eukprot:OHT14620.1 hypothetical protein TRFO_14905 [Tritrichomonas foetus]